MSLVTRGFRRRHEEVSPPDRVPPGQYTTSDFPVLTAGPTPRIAHEDWSLSVTDAKGDVVAWTWDEFTALPGEDFVVDIHCVTKWSKLDTSWTGVSVDTLLKTVEQPGTHAVITSYGGYTTNLPVADLTGGKAWVAYEFGGEPLTPEHGGPARLVVPHLYFWKSAKWVDSLVLSDVDKPGFWESYGYHNYGDPWREQRYAGD